MKSPDKTYWLKDDVSDRKPTLCRAFGVLSVTIGTLFIWFPTENLDTLLDLGGGIFVLDGAGDIITGKHHYLTRYACYNILKAIHAVRGRIKGSFLNIT